MLREQLRRRVAPLLLGGAFLGAYLTMGNKLPHAHPVALDLGEGAKSITQLELAWTSPKAPSDEAALTTSWHFAEGTAPRRLHAEVRLPDGEWDAEVLLTRAGTAETTRWTRRVNLTGTPWWKQDNLDVPPLVLPVREALR